MQLSERRPDNRSDDAEPGYSSIRPAGIRISHFPHSLHPAETGEHDGGRKEYCREWMNTTS
ncbi:hypothetical protein ASZ90_014774 [hydrocarbon metagenome]|uniref:Uncharacterized protein n=1 Tax=hydrocarbon metagenome TaxID=938273 RepID=A0A0W8F4Q7_9ZZZZ